LSHNYYNCKTKINLDTFNINQLIHQSITMTKYRGQHYDASYFMRVLLGLCTVANIFAFQAQPWSATTCNIKTTTRGAASTTTSLMVAVDPTTVTSKELDDIVGADFDKDSMNKRFSTNTYLYPKHVEVIEDIAPIAEAMVNEIVSTVTIVIDKKKQKSWFVIGPMQ